jgi:DNA-binding response OmpR family regulator
MGSGATASSSKAAELMNPRILFVDDEAHMRDILSVYLRDKGMEVTTAATGQQARELFCQAPFDLTILDLNLAGEDGLDVLDFIKRKDSKHPVIIFTGVDDNELFLKQALLGRAHAVVRKMSSLPSLLAEIRHHLPKSPSTGEPHSEPVLYGAEIHPPPP